MEGGRRRFLRAATLMSGQRQSAYTEMPGPDAEPAGPPGGSGPPRAPRHAGPPPRPLPPARPGGRRPPGAGAPAEDLAGLPASDDTAARALDAVATHAAVRLIATLPPDQAEAVLLRAVVGLDATTAAQVLGKRPGAVRTAAHRGLRTLARHLDHAGHRALRAIPSPGPQMPRNAARRDATEGVTGARDSTLKDMR